MNQKIYKIMIWLLPISVAGVIFYMSSQPSDESSQLSNHVIRIMLDIINRWIPQLNINKMLIMLSTPIRKLAHMTEYAIFFMTLFLAFSVNQIKNLQCPVICMLIVFFYACTDEFHQTFVPGRHGCFTDVLIDCTIAGLLTIFCLFKTYFQSDLS